MELIENLLNEENPDLQAYKLLVMALLLDCSDCQKCLKAHRNTVKTILESLNKS